MLCIILSAQWNKKKNFPPMCTKYITYHWELYVLQMFVYFVDFNNVLHLIDIIKVSLVLDKFVLNSNKSS